MNIIKFENFGKKMKILKNLKQKYSAKFLKYKKIN